MSATVSAIAYGTSEAGRAVLRERERDPQVNGEEKVLRGDDAGRDEGRCGGGRRMTSPWGSEQPERELVNAQGNYAGLAEITPCKIVIPP